MRILALDLGTRRVGVAVSDPMGWTAQGLPTLEKKSEKALLEAIKDIVAQFGVERIVVGLPRNMNGSIGPRARKTLTFAEALRKALGLPVELWDERLTTVAAEKSMAEGGVRPSRRRSTVDRVAAQLILQGFLDSLRQTDPQ